MFFKKAPLDHNDVAPKKLKTNINFFLNSRKNIIDKNKKSSSPLWDHRRELEVDKIIQESVRPSKYVPDSFNKKIRTIMYHKRDVCFSCKINYENHGHSMLKNGRVCKIFKFIAVSARNDKDIVYSAVFNSSTSKKIYTVTMWNQGDASCSCSGWRNSRICKHVLQVKDNPDKYKNKQHDAINNITSNSVIDVASGLNAEIVLMEKAFKTGDMIEFEKLKAKIDYNKTMFEVAGKALNKKLADVNESIHKRVFEVDTVPNKIINSENPFGD